MTIQVSTPRLVEGVVGEQAAAIAIGGVFALQTFFAAKDMRTTLREEIRTTPAGYLFLLEENIEPRSVLTRIAQAARRLCFRG
jgi:hypothetical protein